MPSSVNRVILIGHLGSDPELSYSQAGTAKCRFPMATSERFIDRDKQPAERTEWHKIVVYGKAAEAAAKYLAKGRQVFIEGRIQTRNWDDEKTGQKRYMTEVIASSVVFLGGKPSEPDGNVDEPGVGF